VDERLMQSNPCRRVKRPKSGRPEHELWSDKETEGFEKAAAADRLYPVVTLQCLGLRPEEVCALRWRRDVNLKAQTMTVRQARTLADGQAVEKAPKSKAGKRTLPLDESLVKSLKAFRATQAAEKLAAGPAYEDGGYVACDELGRPYDPARLRRVWYRLMKQAGVPKITPYTASRHAAGSYLGRARASPAVIAAWMGHSDPGFTAAH
jgi:integrase